MGDHPQSLEPPFLVPAMTTVRVDDVEQLLPTIRSRPTPHIELGLGLLEPADARAWEVAVEATRPKSPDANPFTLS
jgi:hypothetical protein